ncbi:unnamed protein product [Discula destructiva]
MALMDKANRSSLSSMDSTTEVDETQKTEIPQRSQVSNPSDLEKSTMHSAEDDAGAQEKGAADLPHEATKIGSASASSALHRVDTRPDGSEYPSGVKLILISLALCLAVFLMALDNSIIATAIPHITDEFNSLNDVGWYGSAYLLTTASLQLLYGKLYSYLNIKWVFIGAVCIFELGSLICGVAPSSTGLIVGRAIAGAGSAGLMSGAMVILGLTVPLRNRPAYGGGIASMYGIASVAGPLLGGVFTDKATWRWCFYINLPIGAVALAVIIFFFQAPAGAMADSDHDQPSEDKTWRQILNEFDPVGTMVFMPAIICLLLALQWGGTAYAWGSWRIILCFVLFGLLILTFIYVQYRQQENATVPPRVLGIRTVWAGGFFAFTAGASFFIAIYFLPIWFQAVKGASAVQSGIDNLPMLISTVIMSIVAGAAVSILGYYTPWMLASTVFMSVGYGLASTLKPDSSEGLWIGYQILAGAGMGFGMQQPLMAVQAVLNHKDLPTGTAIIVFCQTIGGSLFVSVGENVFNNKLVSFVGEYAPGMDAGLVLRTGATSIQQVVKEQFPQYLAGVTLAYSDAITQTFLVSAAMGAISIIGSALTPWGSVKGKKVEVGLA